jgi:hypothetical protein
VTISFSNNILHHRAWSMEEKKRKNNENESVETEMGRAVLGMRV